MKIGDILVNVDTTYHDEIMIVLSDVDTTHKRCCYYVLAPVKNSDKTFDKNGVYDFYETTFSRAKIVE